MAIINGVDAEIMDIVTQRELLNEEKYNDKWSYYKRRWNQPRVEINNNTILALNSRYSLLETMDEILKKALNYFNDNDDKFVIEGNQDVLEGTPLLYLYIGKKDYSQYSIDDISDLYREIITFQNSCNYLIDKVNNHIFISILLRR